ncbi:hypothetical protein C8A00DRAFT_35158 [Chaetomidium leptoderma]|uniref:Uncharacterized protein n=1 Tax=Chaetomidium leptoderma TaxID=669021 RepID=A0AAN6VJ15_9PEZI|nr:hypothetical protein C8A00DRAFT_35158 [Chaetomidium leptoderma]
MDHKSRGLMAPIDTFFAPTLGTTTESVPQSAMTFPAQSKLGPETLPHAGLLRRNPKESGVEGRAYATSPMTQWRAFGIGRVKHVLSTPTGTELADASQICENLFSRHSDTISDTRASAADAAMASSPASKGFLDDLFGDEDAEWPATPPPAAAADPASLLTFPVLATPPASPSPAPRPASPAAAPGEIPDGFFDEVFAAMEASQAAEEAAAAAAAANAAANADGDNNNDSVFGGVFGGVAPEPVAPVAPVAAPAPAPAAHPMVELTPAQQLRIANSNSTAAFFVGRKRKAPGPPPTTEEEQRAARRRATLQAVRGGGVEVVDLEDDEEEEEE